jgi:hypothetical protein
MSCEDCKQHSGLEAQITGLTSKLSQIESRVNMKLSRWVFVWAMGVLLAAMYYQISNTKEISKTVSSIDKNIATLGIQLQNHLHKTGFTDAGFKLVNVRDLPKE